MRPSSKSGQNTVPDDADLAMGGAEYEDESELKEVTKNLNELLEHADEHLGGCEKKQEEDEPSRAVTATVQAARSSSSSSSSSSSPVTCSPSPSPEHVSSSSAVLDTPKSAGSV